MPRVAYLLTVPQTTGTIENGKAFAGESDPSEYDEIVTTEDTETIDAFSSHVIHAKMRTAHTGEGINVMTQALHAEDGSLPQGLTVQKTYTKLCSGSKTVTVVVRNSMANPWLWGRRPQCESSHSHLSTRAPCADWVDGVIRCGPRPSNAQVNCEAKAREIVQGASPEWTGILATQAGRFHLVSLGQIPWCLLIGAQWTCLYPFNQTCD